MKNPTEAISTPRRLLRAAMPVTPRNQRSSLALRPSALPLLLLLAAALTALVAALALGGVAHAAGPLTFGDTPTGWSITSGEADAKVGTVKATGVKKNRIRYSLADAPGFSVKGKKGVVSYDGSAISADKALLVVTARDRRGKVEEVSVTITVSVAQAQPEPQRQDSEPETEEQTAPEGNVEGTNIPAWRLLSSWGAGASAPFYTDTNGVRYFYSDDDKDSSTPLAILLSYDTTGLSDAQEQAVQWLALHVRDVEHPYDGMIGNWVVTLKEGVNTRRDALNDAGHVRVQWYDCTLVGASVSMIMSVGGMVDMVDGWR